MASELKLVLTYRVLQYWRTPCALHSGDFPGTKVVNGKQLEGFEHRQLATIRFDLSRGVDPIPMPLCPALPVTLLPRVRMRCFFHPSSPASRRPAQRCRTAV